MKLLTKVTAVVLPLCAMSVAKAEMVANLGYAFSGGENLVETTGEDLDAGAGVFGDIGFIKNHGNRGISYQGTIGFKIDGVEYNDGEADTSSYPLHFLAFYNKGNIRIGGGIVYELSPEYNVSINNGATTSKVEFDNALGAVLEFDQFYNDFGFWGVRYSFIDYDLGSSELLVSVNSGATATSVDGDNLAIYIGFVF